MEELPLELYLTIFNFLNLRELMTMRLVCKKFESIVREFRIRELSPYWSFYSRLDNYWFSSEKLRDENMIFRFPTCLFSKSPFNVQFLKRLRIESLENAKNVIDLKKISQFQHLECLEIGFDLENHKSFSLSLSDLKALYIINYQQKEQLEIVAPKLRALKLKVATVNLYLQNISWDKYIAIYLSQLTFRQPESVRFLSIDNEFLSRSDDVLSHEPYLNQFKNVECMEIVFRQDYEAKINIDPSGTKDKVFKLEQMPRKFPNLKQIHCNARYCYVKKTIFAKVIAQLRAFKRPGLKVYSMDIELSDDPTLIEDFERYREASITHAIYVLNAGLKLPIFYSKWVYDGLNGKLILQLNHYSKLNDKAKTTEWIDYNELVAWLGSMQVEQGPGPGRVGAVPSGLLPIDFFERFPYIRGIRATNRIDNQDAFASFVENCKNLRELSLHDSELGQAFYDQLPTVSSLSFLEIEEASDLNMQFILRMNRLDTLTTNQQLTAKIALKFFRSIGIKLVGKIQSSLVESSCLNDYISYSLKVNEETIEEELTLESLVEHFNSLERR